MKKYLLIDDKISGDSFTLGVYGTLKEANKEAVKEWDRMTDNDKKRSHVYVLDVEEEDCNRDESGNVDWVSWIEGGYEEDRFDSASSGVQTRKYPSNVDIWIKGTNFNFSIDGLCIDDELKQNPNTNKETIISNWIDADIEYMENKLERRLFFNEKEDVVNFLETVYDWLQEVKNGY